MYVHKLFFDSDIGTRLTISLMDHMGTSGDDPLGVVAGAVCSPALGCSILRMAVHPSTRRQRV